MKSQAQAESLERIRDITGNYSFWQGLRWVPLGFVVLIFGLKHAPWWPFTDFWNDVILGLAVLIATAASFYAGTFYQRT